MDNEDLIKKWLNETLTDAEKKVFEASEDYEINKRIVENAKHFNASHQLSVADFEVFKNKLEADRVEVKKLDWWKPLLKIAAVAVIMLGVYFSFFNSSFVETQTLASEKTTIELPDNSQVVLNALTKIEYDKKDWQTNRRLTLDGEAYFKVAKGKTFDVVTKKGVVTVVGTEFNVKQRDDYFEVQCFEGIVRVTSDTIVRQLTAGGSFRILKNQFSEFETTTSQPEWTENKSYFKAVTFYEVLEELERQYNVEVTYNKTNINRLFTGGFTHDNLESALQSITQPMNLTYTLNSSNLVEIHEAKN